MFRTISILVGLVVLAAIPCAHAALAPATTFSQLDDPWLGKAIFVVDRLDDYAEGEPVIPHTLRWATEQLGPEGGIVVFRRSGTITLQRKLRIAPDARNWLVAGYTAPAPGVTVIHHGWDVAGQNWSIEHIRIRPGSVAYDERNGDLNDALGITGQRHVTLSPDADFRAAHAIKNGRIVNCSFSWASDELAQLWFPPIEDIDFVNCLFTEPLHDPNLHPKPEVHGFGPIVAPDVGPVSFQRCVFANSLRRNPRLNDNSLVFIADSMLLNPGGAGIELRVAEQFRPNGTPKTPRIAHDGPFTRPHVFTATGNLFVPGPDTQPTTNLITQGEPILPESRIYVRGNWRWDRGTQTWVATDEANAWEAEKVAPFDHWASEMPVAPAGYHVLSPEQVEAELQANAGAFPHDRDATDRRLMQQLQARTGAKIQRQNDAEIDRQGRPHDADGYEILPENRWSDGDDASHAWALPDDAHDEAAVRRWLEAKRRLLSP